ncbi:MAG: hypothetical protein U5L02_19845 [Rheinheimera sp.]|nr:hypothetical protein [Rheinheimera sp.]
MKLVISMMLLTTFASTIVSANTAECFKHDGQGIANGETLQVLVINQTGKVVRSSVLCGIEQGVLHTFSKQNTSSLFFGSAGEPNADKTSSQKPRQQVMQSYEMTEGDGTLVMVMVIGLISKPAKPPPLIPKWWKHGFLPPKGRH